MRTRLNTLLKEALKAQKKELLSTVRLTLAAIKQKDIEARPKGNTTGISEEEIFSLIQGMIKQRNESISFYTQAGRTEQAAQEQTEIDILTTFLPQQLSDADLESALSQAIQETQAHTVKDMGAVMAFLKKNYAGQIDFSKVSSRVREKLSQ